MRIFPIDQGVSCPKMMKYLSTYNALVMARGIDPDDATIIPIYLLWSRKNKGINVHDIERSMIEHIDAHMPSDDQVKVTSIVVTLYDNRTIAKWLSCENISYSNTLDGIYVRDTDADAVKQAAYNVTPYDVVLGERCAQNGLDVSPIVAHTIRRKLPRGMLKRVPTHPIYPQYDDFVRDADVEVLQGHIDRWCMAQQANTPSPIPGYISLADAATQCNTSADDMLTWLQTYHTDKTRTIGCQLVVNQEFVRSVATTLDRKLSLKDTISAAIAHRSVASAFVPSVRRHINDTIAQDNPEWLLRPIDAPLPAIAMKYIASEHITLAYDYLYAIIDNYPHLQLKVLLTAIDQSLAQVKPLIESGCIPAVRRNQCYYVSQTMVNNVKQFYDRYISVDDLVSIVCDGLDTPFGLAHASHRSAFLRFIFDSEWQDRILDNAQYCYPRNGGFLSLFLPRSYSMPFLRDCYAWMVAYRGSSTDMAESLYALMQVDYPQTVCLLRSKLPKEDTVHKCDMLAILLRQLRAHGREITDYTAADIDTYLMPAYMDASMACYNLFATLVYDAELTNKLYRRNKTTGRSRDTSAYPINCFAHFVAAVVDDVYWQDKSLVDKAIDNPAYADLWVFVALHVMAAWRMTDFVRLPAPKLPYTDEITLSKIKNRTYTDAEATQVTDDYIAHISNLRMTPRKTTLLLNGQTEGITPLYFYVPESCKAPFGVILSVAAAHYGIAGHTVESFVQPRSVTSTNIKGFFGADFWEACDYKPFVGRRANKSLMQAIESSAENCGLSPYVAYSLASDIRSHKYSYLNGKLSRTTRIYLEDGKYSGYDPRYIIEQMFDRGILSLIPFVLLSLTYGDKFDALSISNQTAMIKAIGRDAAQVDDYIQCAKRAEDDAIRAVNTIMAQDGSRSPKETLEAIAFGHASGKDVGSYCLAHGAGLSCVCRDRCHCLGCAYEIKSKSILLQYIKNHDDLLALIRGDDGLKHTAAEIVKAKWILSNVVKPGLADIKACMLTVTTKPEFAAYAALIKERSLDYCEFPVDVSCPM